MPRWSLFRWRALYPKGMRGWSLGNVGRAESFFILLSDRAFVFFRTCIELSTTLVHVNVGAVPEWHVVHYISKRMTDSGTLRYTQNALLIGPLISERAWPRTNQTR